MFWGSKANIISTVCWFICGLLVLLRYPEPLADRDDDDDEDGFDDNNEISTIDDMNDLRLDNNMDDVGDGAAITSRYTFLDK